MLKTLKVDPAEAYPSFFDQLTVNSIVLEKIKENPA